MSTIASLIVQTQDGSIVLNNCISLRFEKERYSSCSKLSGKWCCDDYSFENMLSLTLILAGDIVHYGPPSQGCEVIDENGRRVLKVNSVGYTQALALNQPTPGLLTDVDLVTLATSAISCPNVTYQANTPIVNYVNYYDGTYIWDAIVCYGIRATGTYPYIRGANTVNISSPSDVGVINVHPTTLISFGSGYDFTNMISEIHEADVDGTYGMYSIVNTTALAKNIIHKKEIPFDYEWIMDPNLGLQARINYSMRAMNYDKIKFAGFPGGDIMDYIAINYTGAQPYIGTVSRLIVEISQGKTVTTAYCYHDAYC